jgi:hypothetical protein
MMGTSTASAAAPAPMKSGKAERVLAPLFIFLITLASLAVLVFLGGRSLSCVREISAAVSESAGYPAFQEVVDGQAP